MDNGLTWATLISVLGIAAMGVVAAIVEPPLVSMDDLADRVGATVTLEGTVASLDAIPDHWTRFRLSDANQSVDVVIDGPANVSTGDRIRLTGLVGSYGGRIQLQVESAADMLVLIAWKDQHIDLARLLQAPWDHKDQHVRTSGVLVDRQLVDPFDRFGLDVKGHGALRGPAIVGGLLEFDAEQARFVLDVQETSPLAA